MPWSRTARSARCAHAGADRARADRYGIKTDFLLSPHYLPEWAGNMPHSEGLREGGGLGFLNFNIDHPAAKDAIGRWGRSDLGGPQGQAGAVRASACQSTRCTTNRESTQETLPLYRQYLKNFSRRGHRPTTTPFTDPRDKGFDEVSPPGHGLVDEVEKNRALDDWTRFKQPAFRRLAPLDGGDPQEESPHVPMHAKIMVFLKHGPRQARLGS